MRKYKHALTWLVAVVVLIAIGAAAAWQFYFRPWRQFRANAHLIQMAVERFAVDSQGAYPTHLDGVLVERGWLPAWPPNPFAPGTMHPIAADAPPVLGCFVYVPMGPEIAYPGGMMSHQEAEAQDVIFPSEVDTYELVFYGRGHHTPAVRSAENGTLHNGLTIADQMDRLIRWDQVALVLTAGE